MGFFGGSILVQRFLGFCLTGLREFFWFCFLPPFDDPCYLESRLPLWDSDALCNCIHVVDLGPVEGRLVLTQG